MDGKSLWEEVCELVRLLDVAAETDSEIAGEVRRARELALSIKIRLFGDDAPEKDGK